MEYFTTHSIVPVSKNFIFDDLNGDHGIAEGTTLISGDQTKIPIFDTVSEIKFSSIHFPRERNIFSGVDAFKFSESGEYSIREEYSNQYLFTENDFVAAAETVDDSELTWGSIDSNDRTAIDATASGFNFSFLNFKRLLGDEQPSFFGSIEVDSTVRIVNTPSALSLLGYQFLFAQEDNNILDSVTKLTYSNRLPVLWQRNFFRRVVKHVIAYSTSIGGPPSEIQLNFLNTDFEVPIPYSPMRSSIVEILNSSLSGYTASMLPDARLKIAHNANTNMLRITNSSAAAKYGAEILGFALGSEVQYTAIPPLNLTDLVADIPPQLHQPICLCSEVLSKNITTFFNADFPVDDIRMSPYFIWDFGPGENATPMIRLNQPTYIEYLDLYWGYPRSELGLINNFISGQVEWN